VTESQACFRPREAIPHAPSFGADVLGRGAQRRIRRRLGQDPKGIGEPPRDRFVGRREEPPRRALATIRYLAVVVTADAIGDRFDPSGAMLRAIA
jgi:hypothetical protein